MLGIHLSRYTSVFGRDRCDVLRQYLVVLNAFDSFVRTQGDISVLPGIDKYCPDIRNRFHMITSNSSQLEFYNAC